MVCLCGQHVVNLFYLVRVSVSAKQPTDLLCVSLDGKPGPCIQGNIIVFNCIISAVFNPLIPAFPLYLISYCLNLPFGTAGWGHRKFFVPRAP